MNDKKISEFTQITGSDVDDANDEIVIVDTSASETKAITREELFSSVASATFDGSVTIGGDLTVSGTTVTVDTTTLDVADKNITIAKDAPDAATADGAGLTVDGANATITYDSTDDTWDFNKGISTTGDIEVTGTVDGRDVAADGSKLDGIETNADVTDTANVTAAGALMDSELTSEASVKALDQGVSTTDSPEFAGLTATTVDINGGTINGTVIGGSTPAAISGTTGTFSGDLTVDTNTLFVDASTNNVGIGTSSPDRALTNAGNITSTRGDNPWYELVETDGTTTHNKVRLYLTGDDFLIQSRSDADAFVSNDYRIFRGASGATAHQWSVGSSEAMRIDSSGNIGIGTSSPSVPLTISSSQDSIVRLFSEDQSQASFSSCYIEYRAPDGRAGYMGYAGEAMRLANEVSGQPILFSTNASEAMRIDSSGNVGIGTSSPSTDLDVFGGIRATSSGGYSQITTTSIGDTVVSNNGVNWLTVKNGAPADSLRITSSGNVGIGTSSPGSKLSVVGLPTSSAGLSTGDIYIDAGTLKIVT